jgi:N-acetylglucosamine kinase-like BadF-type ATPase
MRDHPAERPQRSGRGVALGLDSGGTQTRWALADARGDILAEGHFAPLHPAQLGQAAGTLIWQQHLSELAQQLHAAGHPRPRGLHAGLSGYGGQDTEIRAVLGMALDMDSQSITLSNDVEVAYRDVFEPGEGYLIYAGTGSIAVHIDSQGDLHRAGGHGCLLDDAGGGHWIGREALRRIWRLEDECAGAWEGSPMARALMKRLGGSDWSHTRAYLAQTDRGTMGLLATTVAQTADKDPAAHAILEEAGRELGRLGRILVERLGRKPVVLAGRVWALHPAIERACKGPWAQGLEVSVRACRGHHAAARMAARCWTP